MKQPLIILTGPTAVGKTALSLQLAKEINGEIISADSIQVYRHMDIGSAKIGLEERQGICHYLIDELEPSEEFNAYLFQKYARTYCQQIYAKGKIPIIVGGTGFYIQALLYDIQFEETETDPFIRLELEQLAIQKGNEYLHAMLREIDAESAANIHPNNIKRVIRAIEYYRQTGQKISYHNEIQKKRESPYSFVYFVLNNHRDILYERIDKRVDQMITEGLVAEVETLKSMGYDRTLVSMQGLGYKEICAYLDGEISLTEAIYQIKRDTRHFAKRQLTWFRREKEVIWINYYDYENDQQKMLEAMLQYYKNREK